MNQNQNPKLSHLFQSSSNWGTGKTKYYQARTQTRHSPLLTKAQSMWERECTFCQKVLGQSCGVTLNLDLIPGQNKLNLTLMWDWKQNRGTSWPLQRHRFPPLAYTHRFRTRSPSSHYTKGLYFKMMTLHLSSWNKWTQHTWWARKPQHSIGAPNGHCFVQQNQMCSSWNFRVSC